MPIGPRWTHCTAVIEQSTCKLAKRHVRSPWSWLKSKKDNQSLLLLFAFAFSSFLTSPLSRLLHSWRVESSFPFCSCCWRLSYYTLVRDYCKNSDNKRTNQGRRYSFNSWCREKTVECSFSIVLFDHWMDAWCSPLNEAWAFRRSNNKTTRRKKSSRTHAIERVVV